MNYRFSLLVLTVLLLGNSILLHAQKPDTSSLPLEIEAFIDEEIKTEGLSLNWKAVRKMQQEERRLPLAILDARSKQAYRRKHIKGARWVGYAKDAFTIENLWFLQRDAAVIIYSNNGNRGKLAADKLRKMGFKRTYNLLGGFRVWKKNLLPIESDKKK